MMTRCTILLSGLAVAALAASSGASPAAKTIQDLRAAYTGETTASAKYAAYAKVAAAEGYSQVASLFRAASRAEKIHASNHKRELVKLGVNDPRPGAFLKQPGTTRENLADALKGETYEKTTMYPGMIKDATAAGDAGAVTSFTYALAAEKQHAALYAAALKNLVKSASGQVYYVCPVCGGTYKKAAPPACPVCATPGEKFLKIS